MTPFQEYRACLMRLINACDLIITSSCHDEEHSQWDIWDTDAFCDGIWELKSALHVKGEHLLEGYRTAMANLQEAAEAVVVAVARDDESARYEVYNYPGFSAAMETLFKAVNKAKVVTL